MLPGPVPRRSRAGRAWPRCALDFVETQDLLGFQLGHLAGAGPDHGSARGVGLQHELHRPLDLAVDDLAQHIDDEFHGVVVVVEQDHVVGRLPARLGFLDRQGPGWRIDGHKQITHGLGPLVGFAGARPTLRFFPAS